MHRRKKKEDINTFPIIPLVSPPKNMLPPSLPPHPLPMVNGDLETSTLKDCLLVTRTFDLGLEEVKS